MRRVRFEDNPATATNRPHSSRRSLESFGTNSMKDGAPILLEADPVFSYATHSPASKSLFVQGRPPIVKPFVLVTVAHLRSSSL